MSEEHPLYGDYESAPVPGDALPPMKVDWQEERICALITENKQLRARIEKLERMLEINNEAEAQGVQVILDETFPAGVRL